MTGLIRNEIFKVLRLKKLYIFMVVILAVEIITCISFLFIRNANAQMDGQIKASMEALSGQSFPLMMLDSMPQLIIIFLAILLADIISDEYRNGTLKLSLIKPVSRTELLAAKLSAVAVSVVVLMAFTLAASYVTGTVFFGWGSSLSIDGLNLATGKGMLYTLESYLVTLLPYISFSTVIMFISLIFSSMGATIGVSIGVMFALNVISSIGHISVFSIYTQMVCFRNLIININWRDSLTGLAVTAAYALIFYAASVVMFRKKDILM